MTVTPIRAIVMPSQTPMSPLPPSPSLTRQPVKRQLQLGEEPTHAPSEVMEDYGYWNPSPYFGRGIADPILHGHAVEESSHTDSKPSEGRS